jgi:hypothetical protein
MASVRLFYFRIGHSRRQSRKYTGKSDWDEAKAVATVWESAGSSDGVPTPQPLHDKPPQRQRLTLADAAKVFLTSREAAEIAPATMRKYRTFIMQLTAFAADQGYVMLDQFSSADIDVMYSGWKLGPRAKEQTPWHYALSFGSV